MNFYFLLEDEKSFLKVLPSWLEYMNFGCVRVADIKDVKENHYILQSGQGVTQLVTKVLFDTIDTLLLNPGKIDQLAVVLDAEDLEVEDRKSMVEQQIQQHYGKIEFNFAIEIFVCNRCFETWLLGRCGLYPKEVDEHSDFYPYYQHYNVEKNDPERMLLPADQKETIAKYHFHYLHELLRYNRIRYSKNRPQNVATRNYFDGIVNRMNTTEDLKTFKRFYEYLSEKKKP